MGHAALHHAAGNRRVALARAAGLAALVVLAGCDRTGQKVPFQSIDISGAEWGRDFRLQGTDGQPVQLADFRGRCVLLFFGFTQCPDFCPTALYGITQALEKLGPKADKLVPIFITVDPERDTPAQLKNYAQNFDKRIVMLTGSAGEIAAVARAYRVYYAKRPLEKPGEYTMDHSAYIYLLDAGGKYLTHFRHAVPPDELAKALERRL